MNIHKLLHVIKKNVGLRVCKPSPTAEEGGDRETVQSEGLLFFFFFVCSAWYLC